MGIEQLFGCLQQRPGDDEGSEAVEGRLARIEALRSKVEALRPPKG